MRQYSSRGNNSANSSPGGGEFTPRDFWADPKLGWCTDDRVLERRGRELDKAKQKPVYERYLAEVPKHKREKGVHPKTPNKHINFSRRSWDAQLRQWKRTLYLWAGEEPSPSAQSSYCNSEAGDDSETDQNLDEDDQSRLIMNSIQVPNRLMDTDAMASLLGHFDLDTRKAPEADESTLIAGAVDQLAVVVETKGPLDFSQMNNH